MISELENSGHMLWQKIVEQLFLTGASLLIAILISVPLGIFISKTNLVKRVTISVVSAIQTLPSLAVLAFLIPFVGIGVKPAIITLSLYALLPILQNTVTGLNGIQPLHIEAADAMGFTSWQKLRFVELPLSLPYIVAGVRTAAAMCVGIATLAAFVGAGGLGDFIYQGLSLNNNQLIMMGAIPAAILALFIDYSIAGLQKSLKYERRQKQAMFPKVAGGVVLVVLFGVVLFKPIISVLNKKDVVRIASTVDTERILLAEMMAQIIEENTSLKVKRNFTFPGIRVAHQAMLKNEIDIYPSYTGTIYLLVLKGDIDKRPDDLYHYVKKTYQDTFDLDLLGEFGFSNNNALAIDKSIAEKYSIKKISDLKSHAKKLTIAVPDGFFLRPDGYVGLKNTYGVEFKEARSMEHHLGYLALDHKDVQAIMSYTTDAQLRDKKLLILKDDKNLFPDYSAVVIVNPKILSKHPEIETILKPLFGKITAEMIQALNYKVQFLNQKPGDVVREFLAGPPSVTS